MMKQLYYRIRLDSENFVDLMARSSIPKLKRGALYRSMRKILLDVIAQKLESKPYPNRFLIPYRQDGARCPRCGGAIQRTVIFGRTTYFCGTHQRT